MAYPYVRYTPDSRSRIGVSLQCVKGCSKRIPRPNAERLHPNAIGQRTEPGLMRGPFRSAGFPRSPYSSRWFRRWGRGAAKARHAPGPETLPDPECPWIPETRHSRSPERSSEKGPGPDLDQLRRPASPLCFQTGPSIVLQEAIVRFSWRIARYGDPAGAARQAGAGRHRRVRDGAGAAAGRGVPVPRRPALPKPPVSVGWFESGFRGFRRGVNLVGLGQFRKFGMGGATPRKVSWS